MRKLVLIFISLSYLLLWNCSDDESNEPFKIDISGFTFIDHTGYISKKDTTDWRFDDSWQQEIENLFTKRTLNFKKVGPINVEPTKLINSVYAYPNPCLNFFNLRTHFEGYKFYDIRIVDEYLNVAVSLDSILYENISIDMDSGITKDKYRVYYKIYSSNGVYRGHGDVLIGKIE